MVTLSDYQRHRFLFLIAAAIAFTMFWLAGAWFGIPYFRGEQAQILGMPGAVGDLVVIAITLATATAVGTLLTGGIRAEGGLCVATLALSALSIRGGPMGAILRGTADDRGAAPGVMLTLAGELVVLYALAIAAWVGLQRLRREPQAAGDKGKDSVVQGLSALVAQIIVMALLVLLLARTDAKAQALAAVGIAAFLSAAAAYMMFPVRRSLWIWIGPLIVGLLGYVLAHYGSGETWRNGQLTGALGALARPVPLDYASFGPAGALLGMWAGQRWQHKA